MNDYGILSWELRRASYYKENLQQELFDSYLKKLKFRVSDYSEGLKGQDDLAANTARRMIGDLREFIAAVEQEY